MKHYYICTLCILHLCRNCWDFVAAAGRASAFAVSVFVLAVGEFLDFAFLYVHHRVRATRLYDSIMHFSAQRGGCNCFYRSHTSLSDGMTKTRYFPQRTAISFTSTHLFSPLCLLSFYINVPSWKSI